MPAYMAAAMVFRYHRIFSGLPRINRDEYGDRKHMIAAGAFGGSFLQIERGELDVPVWVGHEPRHYLASTGAGTLQLIDLPEGVIATIHCKRTLELIEEMQWMYGGAVEVSAAWTALKTSIGYSGQLVTVIGSLKEISLVDKSAVGGTEVKVFYR